MHVFTSEAPLGPTHMKERERERKRGRERGREGESRKEIVQHEHIFSTLHIPQHARQGAQHPNTRAVFRDSERNREGERERERER